MLDCRVARIVGMEDLRMSKPRMDGFREGAPPCKAGLFLCQDRSRRSRSSYGVGTVTVFSLGASRPCAFSVAGTTGRVPER